MLENIKGKLGFGCMRLPMNGKEVNKEEFNRMIDMYMEADIKEKTIFLQISFLAGTLKKKKTFCPFLKASLNFAVWSILIFTFSTASTATDTRNIKDATHLRS